MTSVIIPRCLLLAAPLALLILMWHMPHIEADGVEVPPEWRAGPLAVYLFQFPYDGDEIRGDVIISLAVWNAETDDPVVILLDGEEAAVITREGFFTYTWKLRGNHHVAVVCRYRIFASASFWVKPPPPPPAMIPLSEFMQRLKAERERITMMMLLGAAGGVPLGIWTKRKTKIRWDIAFTAPAVVMLLGYVRLPQLYMLLPLGVVWALTYWLARDYADQLGLIWLKKNGITVDELYVDDEGRAIRVGLRHWRRGFIRRKPIYIEDEYPVLLSYRGLLNCVCVKEMREAEDAIFIHCSRELAELLMQEGILKRLSDTVEELQTRNTLLESSYTAAAIDWLRRELKARLIGIMKGEMGETEPERLLEWMERAVKEAEKGAKA